MKFKKGDKVRILNKTVHRCMIMNPKLSKGCIGYIIKTREELNSAAQKEADYEVWYNKNNSFGDWYRESDLELVDEKEEKMKNLKYKKGIRDLYINELKGQELPSFNGTSPNKTEESNFITTMISELSYSFYNKINIDEKFIKYTEQHPCFIKWLLENNFLEEVEVFKPFTVEIKIDSPAKFWDLYERLNVNYETSFDSKMKDGKIKFGSYSWDEVKKYKERVK